ncbi:putative LysM domain-containing protein [Seiridium cardinale]|uniref:LysM domain-containing protein n=1 Tax=Seiridium cardinale TaxID=138064 RepID=A0ABR2X714_9PEZI
MQRLTRSTFLSLSYLWFNETTDISIADCWTLASLFGNSAEDFIAWNPSLSDDTTASIILPSETATVSSSSVEYTYPCTASASSSYCVELAARTSKSSHDGPWILVVKCLLLMLVPLHFHSHDRYGQRNPRPARRRGDRGLHLVVRAEEHDHWNPTVGEDCTGLAVGTCYCVSTYPDIVPPPFPYVETDDDTTTTTATATASSSGDGVTTPSPVQTGMTSNCDQFYLVQARDGCWAISQAYDISLDDFYSWNPTVGSDCQFLQADEYVCVGLESS